MTWIGIVVLICVVLFVRLARNGGGGEVGRRIRNSDHFAWECAIQEQEEKLRELREAEPK